MVVYICDSLDLDINEVYEAYQTVPSIKAKDDFLMKVTGGLNAAEIDTSTKQGRRELYKAHLHIGLCVKEHSFSVDLQCFLL